MELARYALIIEKHYGRPMDIEWGKDGVDGKLYILQARPETVKSQSAGQVEHRYSLKGTGTILAEGRVEHRDGVTHLLVRRMADLGPELARRADGTAPAQRSRDFR
jgi:phosphoenolpyruvate synthase/pyruvate phosphate dikinase